MQAILALLLVSLIDPAVLVPGFVFGALQRTPRQALIWSLGWFVFGGAFHEMLMINVGRPWWWLMFGLSGLAGFVWVWIGYGLIGRRRKRKSET
jgi:hypothetical protein